MKPITAVLGLVGIAVAGLCPALPVLAQQASPTTLIHAGTLLAVPGEEAARQQTIVVRDGRIQQVLDGYQSGDDEGSGVTVVDLKDSFVMPGLMDSHVHLQMKLGEHQDRDRLKLSDPMVGMRGIHHGMVTLLAGFTTVRDLGSLETQTYAHRDAVERGWVHGPRIIAAGKVAITGGHVDTSGVKPELLDFYLSDTVCDGPFDCRRAARHAVKYGADLIKITATGGVMTQRATGTGQQMEHDEISEIVNAAHRMGRKVTSHAHQTDGIIAALKGGVDSIEHGSFLNDEAIKLMRQRDVWLIPTLLAGHTVVPMALNSDVLSEAVKQKAVEVGANLPTNFHKAWKAGVRIAYGTDAGVAVHGNNAMEAVLMNRAGMPAMEVLETATVNAAELLGMSDSLGTIEAGKHADIIALRRSPLDDIEALLDVGFVMKGGRIYKQQGNEQLP
ncbi:metal-dependent hydrolase family protein [Kineobactrum salinum]|uniref:Amidohydrolase family protein n=1 Tax=Kineobactrum salinum TaxID=2708301 RepID=A0A6C0U0U1_9GAMM|nr:amidohydrolase family protein [Kineobactrum salinum]QIB65189.1 amidohydrolase family protein [Kineobactrum salinum]